MPDDYEIDLEGGFSGGVEPPKHEPEPEQSSSYNSNSSSNQSNRNQNYNTGDNRRSPLPFNNNNQGYGNNNYNNNRGYPSPQPANEPSFAVIIYNLEWWTNEEEVRGWVVDAGQEKYIKTVIFDEHKVNSKSKGTVYIEFTDNEATRKVYESFINKQKELRESLANGKNESQSASPDSQLILKLIITYTQPSAAPFRTSHNKPSQMRTGGSGVGGNTGGQNRGGMNRNTGAGRNAVPPPMGGMQGFNSYPIQGGFNPMVQFPGGFAPGFGFPPAGYYGQQPPPQQQWQDSNNPHGSKRPRQ